MKARTIAGWKVRRCEHPAGNGWARFGGGWQWKVGVQVSRSRRSVILSLLTIAYRFDRVGKPW